MRGFSATRLSKTIEILLDEAFRVPGTQIRFGLDGIIGLVPGWATCWLDWHR